MPFVTPTFNIVVNVWRNASGPPAVPDLSPPANLAFGRRTSSLQGIESPSGEPFMTLLLPPGTDVRSGKCASGADWVEAPAGTGRYYAVLGVDDIGKSFANEHRAAILVATTHFGAWPSPIP